MLARMAASPVLVAGGFVTLLPEGHLDGDDGMSFVMQGSNPWMKPNRT